MQAPVFNAAYENIGSRDLKDELFGVPVNEALLWEMVRMQEARRRQGTVMVKTRGIVAGSNKKLWRQKGTGRARMGERRSPVWTGGGIVFGPVPRDYYYSMPKKKRALALRSALSAKARDQELVVVESLGLKGIKTKDLANALNKMSVTSALVVLNESNEVIEKSAKNLPWVKVIRCEGLNVYDILRFEKLVFVGDSLEKIQGGL